MIVSTVGDVLGALMILIGAGLLISASAARKKAQAELTDIFADDAAPAAAPPPETLEAWLANPKRAFGLALLVFGFIFLIM